jgi:hypothetical protein
VFVAALLAGETYLNIHTMTASRSLVSPRALVVRSVVSPRHPIAAACRCIDLMQAARLRAKLTAITAAEVFEM